MESISSLIKERRTNNQTTKQPNNQTEKQTINRHSGVLVIIRKSK